MPLFTISQARIFHRSALSALRQLAVPRWAPAKS
jgi:hypothetical protein